MPLRARIARSVQVPPPKVREGMSASHLADVRALPCILCGVRNGIEAHHLLRGLPAGERGMGRKASDRWTLPLCIRDHRAVHAHGDDEAFLAERRVDGRAVAGTLWRYRGDPCRMLRVIERSLNVRGVHA